MLTVGLIGAGATGTAWAKAIAREGKLARVVSVYAPDESAKPLAGEVGATAEVDAADLIAASDAVLIASPTHTHFEYIEALQLAGKPFLCAGPVVASAQQAEQLAAAAGTGATSLPLRIKPELLHLKKAAADGKLGDIGMIRMGLGLSAVAQGAGRVKHAAENGGVLLDVGTHLLDAVQFCFGESTRVHKLEAGEAGGVGEYALLVARLQSGAIAHLECSWREAVGDEFFYYEVAGTQGLIEYDSRKEPVMRIGGAPTGTNELLTGREVVAFLRDPGAAPSLAEGARAVLVAQSALDAAPVA